MSVWYEVEGSFSISKECKFSLIAFLNEEIGIEGCTNVTRCGNYSSFYKYDVFWNNTQENLDAAKEISTVVEKIKSLDKNAVVDFECKIRFIA